MNTKDEGRNMKDEGELIHKYWIEQNGLWEQRLRDVRENGFDNASPIARLVYACQIGQIDQHTSEDLKAISAFIQASYETIENLRSELTIKTLENIKGSSVLDEKNEELARLRKIEAAARALSEKWQKEAWDMVPEVYSSRNLHYKYFKLDNEAGGMIFCAEQLAAALNESEPK